jgi:hypothetical protein
MEVKNYFKSLSKELSALKNRVRGFIQDSHWLTDGEWKESVLKTCIERALPSDIRIGRGFIISPSEVSKQIDILLYSSNSPVLFKDGDLVFLPPEAVLGVIEVKTKVNKSSLFETIEKQKQIGEMLPSKNNAILGIFSYDTEDFASDFVLEFLKENIKNKKQIIHLICLGDSRFFKYWDSAPESISRNVGGYEKWHSYQLTEMAYGYFIHNILYCLRPEFMSGNPKLWFPNASKEFSKKGEIRRVRGPGE